ncbi:hypothetical protein BaRGS_00014905, partial [Batillaria attramentaria]
EEASPERLGTAVRYHCNIKYFTVLSSGKTPFKVFRLFTKYAKHITFVEHRTTAGRWFSSNKSKATRDGGMHMHARDRKRRAEISSAKQPKEPKSTEGQNLQRKPKPPTNRNVPKPNLEPESRKQNESKPLKAPLQQPEPPQKQKFRGRKPPREPTSEERKPPTEPKSEQPIPPTEPKPEQPKPPTEPQPQKPKPTTEQKTQQPKPPGEPKTQQPNTPQQPNLPQPQPLKRLKSKILQMLSEPRGQSPPKQQVSREEQRVVWKPVKLVESPEPCPATLGPQPQTPTVTHKVNPKNQPKAVGASLYQLARQRSFMHKFVRNLVRKRASSNEAVLPPTMTIPFWGLGGDHDHLRKRFRIDTIRAGSVKHPRQSRERPLSLTTKLSRTKSFKRESLLPDVSSRGGSIDADVKASVDTDMKAVDEGVKPSSTIDSGTSQENIQSITEEFVLKKKKKVVSVKMPSPDAEVLKFFGPDTMTRKQTPLRDDVIQLGEEDRLRAPDVHVHLGYFVSRLIELLDAKRRQAFGLPP